MSTTSHVCTLDMSLFRHGDDATRKTFAQTLAASLASGGFVKIINHAIPKIAIEKAFEWVCGIRVAPVIGSKQTRLIK